MNQILFSSPNRSSEKKSSSISKSSSSSTFVFVSIICSEDEIKDAKKISNYAYSILKKHINLKEEIDKQFRVRVCEI